MRVLDLFSGTGGWSEAFLDRGHTVIRIDNDPQFSAVLGTTIMDILDPEASWPAGYWDVVLASPPCQCFSLSSIRHYFDAITTCRNCQHDLLRISGEQWVHNVPDGGCFLPSPTKDTLQLFPASPKAEHALALLERTLEIINLIKPRYWWLENPRGGMKHFMLLKPTTVWYCQYGDKAAKPTHLWGDWPSSWVPRPACSNGNPLCHHDRAPRGSRTGTQGKKGAAARAAVPYQLSLDVCLATEAAIAQQ